MDKHGILHHLKKEKKFFSRNRLFTKTKTKHIYLIMELVKTIPNRSHKSDNTINYFVYF